MKNRNKKLALVAGFVLVVCAGYFFWYRPKFNQANASAASAKPATDVTVIFAQKQKIQLYQELPARVEAFRISEVRPQIEGVLKKRVFTEGSFVKEGQQLYQIDPNIYQIAYDNAQANLKTLQAKKDRYQILLNLDAVSRQEYDDITASLAQARANFKTAKTNLTYTKVLAPISGYVGKSNITEGMLVTANQVDFLTTITQLDPIYVDMAQSTKDAMLMGDQKGIPVSVFVDDIEVENSGTLKFVEVFADETTDSVRLRAQFSNKSKKLIPGMFVTAKLHLKPFYALTVPQVAATRAPDGSLIVWVVENGLAKMRVVKADQAYGDSWIIKEGINEGDTIIYEGFMKIAEGAPVNPVELKAEEKK